jgi:hypothetical protein
MCAPRDALGRRARAQLGIEPLDHQTKCDHAGYRLVSEI